MANSTPLIISIKPSEFNTPIVNQLSEKNATTIEYISILEKAIKLVKTNTANVENDLERAKIVLCGGRGLGSHLNFQKLFTLAKKIGPCCAVGGTRVSVDTGFINNSFQIGQTGISVCADLYIAFGVSGALQHMAGIKTCKTIIAINTDAEANIMKQCDHYVVGDAIEVLNKMLYFFSYRFSISALCLKVPSNKNSLSKSFLTNSALSIFLALSILFCSLCFSST